MEIIAGVHLIPVDAYAIFGVYAPNIYSVVSEQVVLIDTGYKDEKLADVIIDYLDKVGKSKLSHIFITHPHPDHIGGCQHIREVTGAKVVVHSGSKNQAEKLGLNADLFVEDGEIIDIDGTEIEIIHTPGHTSGNMCLFLRKKGILFTGDHVLGIGTTVIDLTDGDMAQYIRSLEKLLNYDIRLICPGHGPLIREPKRKIKELVDHRVEREKQILLCLSRGKENVKDMVAEIYPELDPRLADLANMQVLAHLKKLVIEDKVRDTGEKFILQ